MSDLETRIAASRAELDATLDAIEDKLNVPKRVGELTERAQESYRLAPLPWVIGGVAAAAAVVGLVVWAIVSGDD